MRYVARSEIAYAGVFHYTKPDTDQRLPQPDPFHRCDLARV
jgi:hypothetical protein